MVRVLVSPGLVKKIRKKFGSNSKKVFKSIKKLEENPYSGKLLSQIGRIKLKEIRYENVFRFYFFTNEELIKILDEKDLQDILIKFVDMSKKGKEQQEIINKLKKDLKEFGFDFF
jgi:hypothetical protein